MVFALSPFETFSAELIQVRSSSILQIGDRNRIYTVKLACIEVDPSKEELARLWLNKKLKSKEKVNLSPRGSEAGMLIANIKILSSDMDLSSELFLNGFANKTC